MKTVKNIEFTTKERDNHKPEELDYKKLLELAINTAPKSGFGPKEMKKRLKLLNRLESGNGEFKFEDAEMSDLAGLVKNQVFGLLDPGFDEYFEYIEKVNKGK
jgi:hypothetical protein